MKSFNIIIALLISFNLFSQKFEKYSFKDSLYYKIEVKGNSSIIGQFVEKDSVGVTLQTKSFSKVSIKYVDIKDIDEISQENIERGRYWFSNPNATRYFFAPSAFSLKKGTSYYQNTYIFFNLYNYGITDNISIGGGFETLSLLSKEIETTFYLTPKVGFKLADKVHIGGGIFYINSPKYDINMEKIGRSSSGIVYGVGTYGEADQNITAGLGFYVENTATISPVITLSGIIRVGRKWALITENWFIPNQERKSAWEKPEETTKNLALISYGVRYFGKKSAIDVALINNSDISKNSLLGVPYIDFVIHF